MTKKTICSFYGIMPEMKDYLKRQLKGNKIFISEKPLEKEKLDKNTEILGVFVDSKVDKAVFSALPKLKLVVTMSTGYNHIDLKTAKKHNIPVCNVPTYGENTVAQHAMAFILALSRKLFVSIKRVKEGEFDYHGLKGFDLKDHTVGIIGTGHIGVHLIDMLSGFCTNTIAYDAFPNKKLEDEHKFKYVSLEELLKKSDIISLHIPFFPETYHLIDEKAIKKMKPGVYIINTARGELIDSKALVWGLKSNHVAGAGLDVLESEDVIAHPEKLFAKSNKPKDVETELMTNIIIDHPTTIITPHNAFNSTEALQRIFNTTVDNIKNFLAGKIQNNVTAPKTKK